MWRDAAMWVVVFAITVLETWLATWESKADRNSTSCRTNRWSKVSANWAMMFELVLFVDLWLLWKEGGWLLVPILAGAWWGKYHALERRRAKWRARVKQPGSTAVAESDEDE